LELQAILARVGEEAGGARALSKPKTFVEEYALRWALYAALQNLLDAAAMLVAELGLRKPSSYAEMARALTEAGHAVDAEAFKLMAAARNILAHAYRRTSAEDLLKIVEDVLPLAERLAGELAEVAAKAKVDPRPPRCQLDLGRVGEVFEKAGTLAAYLFGSRARGSPREDSDYDFAVLFEGEATVLDEARLAVKIANALGVPADRVDVVALNRSGRELKARVLKEGRLVYAKDAEAARGWVKETYLDVLHSSDLDAIYLSRALTKLWRAERLKST
jgi:uncharacterized protein YutE (UPF0331/DUF86 family)/predicted nucleotidyltransferase